MARGPAAAATAAAALPMRSTHGDLGGAHRVASLVTRLEGMAFADPRASPHAATVVDADAALHAVLDAFDGAREKLLRQLCALHEEIEVQRASGALDVPAFVSALRAFDGALSESAAYAIYVDCDLAAAEEFRRRELAAQAAAAKGKGTDAHAAALPPDAVPRHAFLRICEDHGVARRE